MMLGHFYHKAKIHLLNSQKIIIIIMRQVFMAILLQDIYNRILFYKLGKVRINILYVKNMMSLVIYRYSFQDINTIIALLTTQNMVQQLITAMFAQAMSIGKKVNGHVEVVLYVFVITYCTILLRQFLSNVKIVQFKIQLLIIDNK